MCGPGDHRVEHHRGPIGQRVLVIASRDPAPLLDVAVAAFDDIAAAVGVRVEVRRPAAG